MNELSDVATRTVPVVTYVPSRRNRRVNRLRLGGGPVTGVGPGPVSGGGSGPVPVPVARGGPLLRGAGAVPRCRAKCRAGWRAVGARCGALHRVADRMRRKFAGATDLGMSTAEYAVGTNFI
ncbi:hypothetical protein [Kitasatospora sp. LaBMicrA B282]|uniref:hypothetical protein n=1 Tax=Kitasatospora sp. LaBMicrA B282 TaxID=3420949 RepID=UPI003D12DFD7